MLIFSKLIFSNLFLAKASFSPLREGENHLATLLESSSNAVVVPVRQSPSPACCQGSSCQGSSCQACQGSGQSGSITVYASHISSLNITVCECRSISYAVKARNGCSVLPHRPWNRRRRDNKTLGPSSAVLCFGGKNGSYGVNPWVEVDANRRRCQHPPPSKISSQKANSLDPIRLTTGSA